MGEKTRISTKQSSIHLMGHRGFLCGVPRGRKGSKVPVRAQGHENGLKNCVQKR